MRIIKILLLCVILINIGFLVYFFLNIIKSNNTSYKFAEFNASINQTSKAIETGIESGNTKLTLSLPVSNAKMSKAGNTTTFDSSNTTFNYEIKKEGPIQGLKETIVLKNKNAPNEYSFNFKLENVNSFKKDPEKKVWHFFNSQSKEIFYIPGGIMKDKDGKVSDLVDIKITKNNDDYILKLTADKDWIKDPDRSFPIKVDPSVLMIGPKLHLNVTSVGRFRWKLAVEYEIRDEEGKVLGSDVVITDVRPQESNTGIAVFLRDYFTRRLAIWSLAQGNFTLKEMSNDRLSSSHFQKEDSGDDVNDKYKDARLARKQIIDSFSKATYPDISLTLAEADLLQKPEYDEVDESGKPTGRKIQSKPVFKIENEKIGAGTEILRPNGAGDSTAISSQNPGTGSHWDKVAETSADDNTTYVYAYPTAATDYYALADTALTTETVNSIDVTSRAYNSIPSYLGGGFETGVRLSATNSQGALYNNSVWTTNTDSALSRPGGGSWAVADLNSLQVIALMFTGYGDETCDACLVCSGFYSTIYLTQVYVTVNYSAAPTPTSGGIQIKGGVQIKGGTILR